MRSNDPLSVLHQYWGYDSFRLVQREVIDDVLGGRDVLALLPTGGGKSLCYQVSAMCLPGITIVVSPLIALMKDQIEQLKSRRIPAEAIYSGMTKKDIDRILDNAVYGNLKLLYLAPERLSTPLFSSRYAKMPVSLIAVDEAHCISHWGHDFRPDYRSIDQLRVTRPQIPILALTATATQDVVSDIQEQLKFRADNVIKTSFERPNLSYNILEEEHKLDKVTRLLQKNQGSAIVYTRSRKRTADIARFLSNRGLSAAAYHAGLSMAERNGVQEAWLKDERRIIVATNAFGMGIDKPDVRWVIHFEVPPNLEEYFQEAGRAGRDGKASNAVLLYHPSDLLRLEQDVKNAFPSIDEIRRVYHALGVYFQSPVGDTGYDSFDFDIIAFCHRFQFSVATTFHCIKQLQEHGYLQVSEGIYHPARIFIKVGKNDLYDYQLRYPLADKVLKYILRNYEGVFSALTSFSKKSLCQRLSLEKRELQRLLSKMADDGIIDYIPEKDKPQLTFTNERLRSENIFIDLKTRKQRQKLMRERLNAVRAYVHSSECRSNMLLRYFGEVKDKPCGVCDHCRGSGRRYWPKKEVIEMQGEVLRLLRQEGVMKLHDVVDHFPIYKRKGVVQLIDEMITQGLVNHENYSLKLNLD